MSESFVPADAEPDPAGVMFTPVPREVVLELHAMVQQADALVIAHLRGNAPLAGERAAFLYQQIQARALVVLLASMVVDAED